MAETCNPKPDPADIILPMPCDLEMVFRAVAVPGEPGRDLRFVTGMDHTGQDRRLYEQRGQAHIAGAFTVGDLPAAWRARLNALSPAPPGASTLYFIGKYEVSAYQWNAVMEPNCAARSLGPDALPVREKSWFEVQEFLRRYNRWLIRQAASRPDILPRFAGNSDNIGYLRLPTEDEWEFAARGGLAVSEAERGLDHFPLGEATLKDYGVFSGEAPAHEPEPIGGRRPNPLGLYDTVGNVKEMTQDLFRFAVSGRRGGAAGGVLCKGGSFRNRAEETVLPGWRDELKPYTASGESRPSDLGFRLVLSGINVPSAQRLEALTRLNLPPGGADHGTGAARLPAPLLAWVMLTAPFLAGLGLMWWFMRRRRAETPEPTQAPQPNQDTATRLAETQSALSRTLREAAAGEEARRQAEERARTAESRLQAIQSVLEQERQEARIKLEQMRQAADDLVRRVQAEAREERDRLTAELAATRSAASSVIELPEPTVPTAASPEPVPDDRAQSFTNSLGMRFARIPAGLFVMGSPEGVGNRDEWPAHEARISRPFFLGVVPVTQAQWEQVMDGNPSAFRWPDNPVENVSWQDAQEFIRRLNARERQQYRLPTEAEWEYAARAGSRGLWASGDDPEVALPLAWCRANSGGAPQPAGMQRPNAWGLLDMHGNVREWVQDWYAPYAPSSSDPARNPTGPATGVWRVARGGGWNDGIRQCRSAHRLGLSPQTRSKDLGFRLALSCPGP